MKLDLEPADLRPLVQTVLAEVLSKLPQRAPERLSFSAREAAEVLGLTTNQVREARRRGELRGKRLGRTIVYERAELLRFLANAEAT